MIYYYVCNTCKNVYMFNIRLRSCPNFNCRPVLGTTVPKQPNRPDELCKLYILDEYMASIVNRLHKKKCYTIHSCQGHDIQGISYWRDRLSKSFSLPYLDVFTYTPKWVNLHEAIILYNDKAKKKDRLRMDFRTVEALPTYTIDQENELARLSLEEYDETASQVHNASRFVKAMEKVLNKLEWL